MRFTLIKVITAIIFIIVTVLLVISAIQGNFKPLEHSYIKIDGQVMHDPDCMHPRCWD